MKIAHISILSFLSSGILKAAKGKSRIARENNLDIDFYFISVEENFTIDNLFAIGVLRKKMPFFLRKIILRIFKFSYIKKNVPLERYDAIVLRYPLMDGFGSIRFGKDYGYKLFSEHHTDEISELYSIGRLLDSMRAYLEKKYAGVFLSNVRGIIGVTNEITVLELTRTGKKISSKTIANGIDLDGIKKVGFKSFDGVHLSLVFVASQFFSWHGLEKFLKILFEYKGDVHISLKLIGQLSSSQRELINNAKKDNLEITASGKIPGENLDGHLVNANLAISSLALSKKGMQEACPLKSREYIARGIPFFYAYKDTDLTGDESFAKRFSEENISVEGILEFAEYISSNRERVERDMKKYVDIISWKNKLIQMKQFVEENL